MFHIAKVYQSLMKVDAERVRAFSVDEGGGLGNKTVKYGKKR